MSKILKILFLSSFISISFGFSTVSALDFSKDNQSTKYYWDAVPYLATETELNYEERVGTQAIWYDDWGKGTLNLTASNNGIAGEAQPTAYPVSRITANAQTERDDALGTSSVVVILMRDGQEIDRDGSTPPFAKTASASAVAYPGIVPVGTEYRAHGTHTITKPYGHSVGYTGDSLSY